MSSLPLAFQCFMNKFTVLANFNQNNFKHKIKHFAIRNGNAFLLTDQGQLFGFGKNKDGFLGLGHQDPVYEEPALIDALKEKKIVDVTIGDKFVVVLTEDKQAWAWEKCGKPELLRSEISTINGTFFQILLLTTTGQVYEGEMLDNPDYTDDRNDVLETKLVPSSEVFIKIARGLFDSFALTHDHRLMAWGMSYENIGKDKQWEPVIVQFEEEQSNIKDIACGGNDNLALFENGNIWYWSSNNYILDILDSKFNRIQDRSLVPRKVCSSSKFQSICESDLSAAIAEDGFVYVLGGRMRDPVRTPFTNYTEAFAFYYSTDSTPHNMLLENIGPVNPVFSRIAASFNDADSSDIEFVVDGQSIHAHRQYLSLASPYFERMLREEWKSGDGSRIEISEYSHSAYSFLIRYLYTGHEDVAGLDIAQLIDLLDLATAVLEEPIRQACIKGLLSELCIEHACITYRALDQYDLVDSKPQLVKFIQNNLKQIVQTDAFKQMKPELVKKLMIDFS